MLAFFKLPSFKIGQQYWTKAASWLTELGQGLAMLTKFCKDGRSAKETVSRFVIGWCLPELQAGLVLSWCSFHARICCFHVCVKMYYMYLLSISIVLSVYLLHHATGFQRKILFCCIIAISEHAEQNISLVQLSWEIYPLNPFFLADCSKFMFFCVGIRHGIG